MKIAQILTAALAMSASAAVSATDAIRSGYGRVRNLPNFKFEKYRPSRHRARANGNLWSDDGCTQSSRKEGLPRGYPGAKLARKAILKQVAVKHPRGLRLDGATV